jgi:transcriptional antiterminator
LSHKERAENIRDAKELLLARLEAMRVLGKVYLPLTDLVDQLQAELQVTKETAKSYVSALRGYSEDFFFTEQQVELSQSKIIQLEKEKRMAEANKAFRLKEFNKCVCGHFFWAHGSSGECTALSCSCKKFVEKEVKP